MFISDMPMKKRRAKKNATLALRAYPTPPRGGKEPAAEHYVNSLMCWLTRISRVILGNPNEVFCREFTLPNNFLLNSCALTQRAGFKLDIPRPAKDLTS